MPINRKIKNLQEEIDNEGEAPDINKIRREHQLLAERNKNLILGFSKNIYRLLIGIFIAIFLLILFTGYYNDKISCEREGPTRTSLLALRMSDEGQARARRKTAALEPGTQKAAITLAAATEEEEQAKKIDVAQLKCEGIPQGR